MVTIFYWRKELGQADLSDTLNMFVNPIENFLEAFEKKVSAPKMGFCQNLKSGWNILTNPIFGAETFFKGL